MNNDTKKIIELIKNDKNIAAQLFLFSSWVNSKKNTSLFITNENKDIVKGTEWIYKSKLQSFLLIGIFKWKEKVLAHAIDDQTDYACCINSFQDIPYEIIRRESYFTKDKTVESYLIKNPEVKNLLIEYEKFCYDNNIKLDEENVYHNKNGILFKKYFELKI